MKLAEKNRDERVSKAMSGPNPKITPAQKEWAEKYAMTDPVGFDTFVKIAPVVIQFGEIGHQGNEPGEAEDTKAEAETGEKLGVSKEDRMKFKKSQKLP